MTDLPLIDQETDRRGHGKLHFQKALKYQDLLIFIKQTKASRVYQKVMQTFNSKT